MCFANHFNFSRLSLVAALAGFLAVGCDPRGADEALNKALKDSGKAKESVYPLAGKVTIDGAAPKIEHGYRLVVVLYDPAKPDLQVAARPNVEADTNGDFQFSTYGRQDGVKPAKYTVLFGVFRHRKTLGLVPPDQLHNLYNDPDENAKKPEFVIDHKAPGEKNLQFNLAVAGKEPVAEPGPHALVGVMDENDPGAARVARRARSK